MRKLFICLSIGFLACLPGLVFLQAQLSDPGAGEPQVFPQIFHLDSLNTSQIHVQNPGDQEITATLELRRQDGSLLLEQDLLVPANGSVRFSRDSEPQFVASAALSCNGNCVATATWHFNIREGRNFDVGVLPQSMSQSSAEWVTPVPEIRSGSAFGFAVFNPSPEVALCSLTLINPSGEEVSSEMVNVPARGQVAQFAQDVEPGFFGGSRVACDQEVVALAIVQDILNGFPTSLNFASQIPGVEDLRIIPQIFSLDDGNTSQLYVQNTGPDEIQVAVEFFAQDGTFACADQSDCPIMSLAVPPTGTVRIAELPRPFVGSAVVFCTGSCVAMANWSFNIQRTEAFQVGVTPHLFHRRTLAWGSPVPLIQAGSAYGFAIYNTTPSRAVCNVTFYRSDGSQESSEEIRLAGNGQVAKFADGIGSGFAGTSFVSCNREVVVTGLVQNFGDGFPTNLNYAPLL